MDGQTLIPLPHWVCTVVAVPRGAHPLGHPLHLLLQVPLLAGGDIDVRGEASAWAEQERCEMQPFAQLRALIAVAEGHARTGDATAQIDALDAVRVLCERLRGEALASVVGEPLPPDGLTVRETEVLRHLAGGMTIRQVAAALCLSPRTVERHITTIYRKIGARGRVDATAYALRHDLAAGPAYESL
jgi:DNA-binding CsgD family transcriptional regulator